MTTQPNTHHRHQDDFISSFNAMDEVSFSDLQLKGKATVERWLRSSAGRPLRVRRRDAED